MSNTNFKNFLNSALIFSESGTKQTISVHNKALINLNGVLYLIEKIPEAVIQNGQTFKVVPKVNKNGPKVNKNKGARLDTGNFINEIENQ